MQQEFNLTREPWIRVIDSLCSIKELSIEETLLHAHEYERICGELPTQDVAILRFLLSLLHTVFGRMNEAGEEMPINTQDEAIRRWKALWDLKSFPEAPVLSYLHLHRDDFWLFHPTRPFYQTPAALVGTEYGSQKLNGELSESGNKIRLFPVRTGADKQMLKFGEAARWLLHVNGFDDTSSKPKGKNLPSPGAGWLGKIGLVYACGRNLFETLMLNLVLLKDGSELWKDNCPSWEKLIPASAERVEIPIPDNQAELLSLQSRRIILIREQDKVIGYRLLGGDFFNRVNALSEQMTIWKLDKDKKNAVANYLPRRHDPSKQMWREFQTLFETFEGNRKPGVVAWIELLRKRKVIERKRMIRFAIASVQYGDKDFFVTDIFMDSLQIHADVLTEIGSRCRKRIAEEIEKCEKTAEEIKHLHMDIKRACGGSETATETVKQYYERIDLPFRIWIETIDPSLESIELIRKCREWEKTAKAIALQCGENLIRNVGVSAVTGRMVTFMEKGKEVSRYYSAADSFNIFRLKISRIFDEENRK